MEHLVRYVNENPNLFFSSHWEVGSSMNCFVTEGGGGGGGGGAEEAEQENSHFLQ